MTAPSTINTNLSKQTARASAAVGVQERDVTTTFFEAGAKSPESSSPGGKHSPKARAFWARKEALRKQPNRCTRCAKPYVGKKKQCPTCLEWAAQYRARKRIEEHGAIDAKAFVALEKRVANLEHYFARLSTLSRVEYKRGYCAGRRLHRKAQDRTSYYAAMPQASAQELAELSHEYRR